MSSPSVYILTRGRVDKQTTYRALPPAVLKHTNLVVSWEERDQYPAYPIIVPPRRVTGVGAVRQWIIEHHAATVSDPRLVMLDDDLRFDVRRADADNKFRVATPRDVEDLFTKINQALRKYAHVGVLAREGGNRVAESTMECARMLRVLAYDASIFLANRIKYNRLDVAEDFDVTLQLLRKGFKNLILCHMVQGQGQSNAPGGCSLYRTMELQEQMIRQLAAIHAPFVRVVEKTTKVAWGGQTRVDAVISWKKAYASSQRGT